MKFPSELVEWCRFRGAGAAGDVCTRFHLTLGCRSLGGPLPVQGHSPNLVHSAPAPLSTGPTDARLVDRDQVLQPQVQTHCSSKLKWRMVPPRVLYPSHRRQMAFRATGPHKPAWSCLSLLLRPISNEDAESQGLEET